MDSRNAELLAKLVASDDVRQRGLGVIATWLAENTEIPDVIVAARELIKAEGDAGLVTAIKTDLDSYIEGIRKAGKQH